MKLDKLNPKLLFRSKKSRSVSGSDTPWFSSGSSSSSSDASSTNLKGSLGTPKSVLPSHSPFLQSKSNEISEEWSDLRDASSDNQFELEQAFKLIDKDGDGKITKLELETLLSRTAVEPPSEKQLMLMLKEVDRDGDGCITLEEFRTISSAFGPAHGSELRDAFDIFDVDRDGKISADELLGVFKSIGDDQCTLEDCRRMIGGVDTDGDGFVCFEDFTRMMEQLR